ncbi:MAG: polysaccharide export protein [Acidobacteriaceae bacterium]|nr:polysaccharide export protein [Acidobacteriaceae bacterium]
MIVPKLKTQILLTALLIAVPMTLLAQQGTMSLPARSGSQPAAASAEASDPSQSAPTNYILGPQDQITLYVADAEEMNDKPIRIDMRGDLSLPMAGRVHAAGLTIEQLESEIENRLKKYLTDPDVVVSVTEFRSQPVSVFGAVGKPGVHQLEGRKTLIEVLSLAGGLRDDAGNSIKITRSLEWGPIPLPDAKDDPTGRFSMASLSAKSVLNGSDPRDNIVIRPNDVISVPKADLVYVVGSVHKPGGFPLGQNGSLSTLQVLSLAEGLDKTAAPDKAKIMRQVAGQSNRTEIAVNLKKLMAGKDPDLPLRSDDILFVPNSAAKNAAGRGAEAAIQIITGLTIYGRL